MLSQSFSCCNYSLLVVAAPVDEWTSDTLDKMALNFLIFLTFLSCVVCNKYLDLKFEQVMVSHEEWCDTNTCVNTRIQAVRQELENSQKSVVDVDADVDL
jgi:hypothetical protein